MQLTPEQINRAKWERGALKFLIRDYQLPIYNSLWSCISDKDPEHASHVINCARQFGKSFTEFVVGVEYCIRHPRSTVLFVAPLKTQALEIITGNTFYRVFETCPEDLKPKVDGNVITFPNQSRFRLGGTDNRNYQNLRGGAANLLFFDEAGFMSYLDDVISTLQPMLDSTGGKSIFSSTPPDTPDHAYTEIFRDHAERDHVNTFTVFDNTSKTTEDLQKIFAETKSTATKFSTRFRREYLCEFVTEETKIIARDWDPKYVAPLHTDQYYPYYHKYVSIDPGVTDLTAVLFGYYDFSEAILWVIDELYINGPELNTAVLAKEIKDKMKTLWGQEFTLPYRMVADNNNKHLIQDLGSLYGLPFYGTTKTLLESTTIQEQEGMVNTMNRWFCEGRVRVTPNCPVLAKSLEYGVWSDRKGRTREFGRSRVYGHYDAVAAMMYLIRNIDIHSNPIPKLLHADIPNSFVPQQVLQQQTAELEKLSGMLVPKRVNTPLQRGKRLGQ